MNSETLERLMIDHAAGEMLPDTEELLEAWLMEKPAARNEADEIEETISLARQALREDAQSKSKVVVLPAKRSIWRNRALALAACFAGGLLLGVALRRGTQVAPPAMATRSIASAMVSARQPSQSPKTSRSVWSLATLHRVSAPEKNNIVWISPVRKPKIL